MGIDRDGAARISFLMLIPVVAGATVFKAYGRSRTACRTASSARSSSGSIASAVSGYLAIAWLLRFVRTHSYDVFVIYRFIVGLPSCCC